MKHSVFFYKHTPVVVDIYSDNYALINFGDYTLLIKNKKVNTITIKTDIEEFFDCYNFEGKLDYDCSFNLFGTDYFIEYRVLPDNDLIWIRRSSLDEADETIFEGYIKNKQIASKEDVLEKLENDIKESPFGIETESALREVLNKIEEEKLSKEDFDKEALYFKENYAKNNNDYELLLEAYDYFHNTKGSDAHALEGFTYETKKFERIDTMFNNDEQRAAFREAIKLFEDYLLPVEEMLPKLSEGVTGRHRSLKQTINQIKYQK